MSTSQPAILAPDPAHARYLQFNARAGANTKPVLADLAAHPLGENMVIGFGPGLIQGLGVSVEGLRPFPALSGPGLEIPSTQCDIWIWIGGADRGDIAKTGNALGRRLAPAFVRADLTDGFMHGGGRDLTGYEDGTENPEGDAAMDAATVQGGDPDLDGSSFVAVQQWVHDLGHFASLPEPERDNIIGRRISNNEEFDDAPISAHVKRTAQESFDPEAFILRRSMPFADASGEGLMFVAFGKSLDVFEVQLRRMVGAEDGVVDALFRFSRPVSGGYYWCPPVDGQRLDLRALDI
ncbi:MAG: Dyp-type peroxidase [Alphaproteobacteria bacterium]|nr:Dyp-type peroxidase [Alphaproteobacteria bacterium]